MEVALNSHTGPARHFNQEIKQDKREMVFVIAR